MLKPSIEIYTDGACLGNPGPGGWAALIRFHDREQQLSGFEAATTNNRMELQAVIAALASLEMPCDLVITTDSQYVRQGMMEWISRWQKNGWRTANKQPVKNSDLWRQLLALSATHEIDWRWVKGHSGHPDNELVDQLARHAAETQS